MVLTETFYFWPKFPQIISHMLVVLEDLGWFLSNLFPVLTWSNKLIKVSKSLHVSCIMFSLTSLTDWYQNYFLYRLNFIMTSEGIQQVWSFLQSFIFLFLVQLCSNNRKLRKAHLLLARSFTNYFCFKTEINLFLISTAKAGLFVFLGGESKLFLF